MQRGPHVARRRPRRAGPLRRADPAPSHWVSDSWNSEDTKRGGHTDDGRRSDVTALCLAQTLPRTTRNWSKPRWVASSATSPAIVAVSYPVGGRWEPPEPRLSTAMTV